MSEQRPASEPIVRGEIQAIFAFDAGFQIDLRRAATLVREGLPERVVRLRRPSPAWFDYESPPLRVTLDGAPIVLGDGPASTDATAECLLFDFGAAVMTYTIPFSTTPSALIPLARALYDNADLIADARRRLGVVFEGVRGAITSPELSDQMDDYMIVGVRDWSGDSVSATPESLLEAHADAWARVLLAETGALHASERDRTISARLSYAPDELVVIDWNAALVIAPEPEDVIAVLRHANVELLEMRLLDAQLDRLLDSAHELIQRVGRRGLWPSLHDRRLLAKFAEIQTDSAIFFEVVNNAIKLLGDQYLARVYRQAARRLDLPEWDAAVLRKIATAESIYQKMTDAKATKRMELLEVIIIVLIFISMVMPLIPGLGGH